MQNCLPSAAFFQSRKAALAGLASGIIVTLVLGTLAAVAYTGKGLSERDARPPQVYFF